MIREWQDGMHEVSGFGGSYEKGCQAMVLAGFHWLDEHPDANPSYKGFKGVFGLIEDSNDDAKALDEAILNAKVIAEDGKETIAREECTGAMHHAAVMHCMFYKANGWDVYVAKMKERD